MPLTWRADWPDAKPVETLVHRGTDIELQPTWFINKTTADTNGWTFTTFCQTNAVGPWFGPLPGAFFSHTNDIGAAFYNVMVRAQTPGGAVNYTAFARLRMLDSPGFAPGELPLPVPLIDFSKVVALNAPWLLPAATNDIGTIKVELGSISNSVSTNSADIATLKDTTATLSDTTATINSKIPSAASASNQLADKEWIDDEIDTYAAYYITYTAAGAAFPTRAALTNATVVYSGGAARTPTRNDYAVVLADETHGGAEWRYIYTVAAGATSGQWDAQYPIETNDYDGLSNKPQINGSTLTGNKTAAQLGLAKTADATLNAIPWGAVPSEVEYDGVMVTVPVPQWYDTKPDDMFEWMWYGAGWYVNSGPDTWDGLGSDRSSTTFEYTVVGYDIVATRSLGFRLGPDDPSNPNHDKLLASEAEVEEVRQDNAQQSASIESNRVSIVSNSTAIAELTDTTSTLNDSISTLSADKADRSELAGYATPADVYRIVAGTNVILVITNYNSTVHAPSMKLQHLDPETGEYVTYWDEARGHGITLTNAMDYADGVAARLDAAKAPRAWSRTTSGLGADAPEGTTFISTPVTHISGGFEFEKKITAGGTVWTLCTTSLAAGSTTNGFFEISALDGTPVFSVEKTDSVLVGVNPSAIAVVGNACVISVPAVADTHPFARVATTLVQPTWYKEDSDGMPAGAPASVTWSGQSGAWVATVDFGASPEGFVFFEYLQEGGVKIVNSAVVDLSHGVHYGGATYMPTVSGSELKFIRQ